MYLWWEWLCFREIIGLSFKFLVYSVELWVVVVVYGFLFFLDGMLLLFVWFFWNLWCLVFVFWFGFVVLDFGVVGGFKFGLIWFSIEVRRICLVSVVWVWGFCGFFLLWCLWVWVRFVSVNFSFMLILFCVGVLFLD